MLGVSTEGTQPSSELLVRDIFMTCSFEVNHAGMLSRAFLLGWARMYHAPWEAWIEGHLP